VRIPGQQFARERGQDLEPALCVTVFDDEVLPFDITEIAHAAHEGCEKWNARSRSAARELAQPIHLRRLLRARRERPRRRPTADDPDELAPLHSITSSARASSVGGTSRPSALAVLRLITNSYLVGA